MCLILCIPDDGEALSIEESTDVWDRNKDGGCVIDTRSGEILYRGLDREAMTATVVGQTGIVAHWRHGTSGPVDLDRCHGWRVGGGFLLHNGTIPWAASGHSDTSALVEALRESGIDVADAERHGKLLDGLADRSVIVVAPVDGGPPIAYGDVSRAQVWRGRWYSNGYAWTGTTHGKPAPIPSPGDNKPSGRQAAWEWGSDDIALYVDDVRRRARGGKRDH